MNVKANWLDLTDQNNNPVCVNVDAACWITPAREGGTNIVFPGSDGKNILVTESFKHVLQMMAGADAPRS